VGREDGTWIQVAGSVDLHQGREGKIGMQDSERVTEFGIGLTDLVKRPTKGSDELSVQDFRKGRVILSRKLKRITPSVIAFNGKIVYERFMRKKCEYGLQDHLLYGAQVYVMPSTSRRCGRISYSQNYVTSETFFNWWPHEDARHRQVREGVGARHQSAQARAEAIERVKGRSAVTRGAAEDRMCLHD
jgi:G:T/U-mismatch repair DNA glycosylase